MPNSSTAHEVLTAVFQVRHFPATPQGTMKRARLSCRLLWQRALDPQRGSLVAARRPARATTRT